eukprot:CCRYP_003839-RB/>CCRYP_003839-RB protein AED:0.01 eAED:0.01 QI:165/1/1/1/1/1/2/636/1127
MTSTSRSVRLPSASSSSSSSSSTDRILGCIYDPSSASLPHPPGQPRFSPIAHFVSAPNDGIGNDSLSNTTQPALPSAGRLLAVNSSYVAYAVKKGLVRIIDRRTSAKTLLRGHGDTTRIVDAAFFGADVDGQKKEGAAALWNAMRDVRCGRRGGNASSSSSSLTSPPPPPPAAASDILATVGGMQDEACVLIWRIYVHPGNSPSEDSLAADKLIELRFPLAARILWHPFDPNRFLLLHRNDSPPAGGGGGHLGVATLVETKCLVTTRHTKLGHMVCDCPPSTVPGATQFIVVSGVHDDDDVNTPMMGAGVNDASWSSRDARHVLTAHDDGMVRLWDVVLPPETVGNDKSFRCVGRLDVAAGHRDEARRVTRVIFLSQYETSIDTSMDGAGIVTPPFVTGTSMNHELTLWSGFGVSSSHTVTTNGNHPLSPPQRLYVFQLQSTALPPTAPPSIASMINVELCPAPYRPADTVPSSLLLLSERSNARMHALHLDTQWKNSDDTSAVAVTGFDYVTTLDVVHPVLSLCVAASSSSSTSFPDNGGTSSNCLNEEKDVDLGCVQTKAVQMLSLSAEMVCAPPPVKNVEGGELSNGVRLLHWKKDEEEKEETDKEEEQNVMEEMVDFDEEYDLEEDNTQAEVEYNTGDDDEEDNVPKESSAPLLDNDAAAVDPFSNWLGAIVNPLPPPTVPSSNHATTTTPTTATKVKTATVQPPPPPPGLDFMFPPPPPGLTPSAPMPPVKEEMAFLSPMQLLGKSIPDPVLSSNVSGKSRDESTSAKKSATQSTKKKKGGGGGGGGSEHTTQKPPPPPPTAILQREEAKGDTRSSSHPSVSNVDIRSIENAVERIMATHVKSLESKVVDTVRKTVTSEVQLAMEKATERALRDAMFHQKLEKAAKDSAATAARDAVAAMQAPMVTAFHQTMKEIMVPAYEAATSQMFHQMSKTMDHGLAQIATSQAQSTSSTMEAMSQQVMKMSEAIQSLSSEVAQLRSAGVAAAAANNGGQTTTQKAPHPPPRPVDTRQEILSLCQARRYEEAFTKAVSAANGDVVLFTCKHADITAAFNGEVTLSQTILICLMQQLGAVLVSATDTTDFKIIVTWLQEIAVTIDPTNENIKRRECCRCLWLLMRCLVFI